MDPELLLHAVYTTLHRAPPAGLDADDVDGFFARNRASLLQAIRQAFPAPALEPAFTRFREEHRLGRLLLDAIQRHLDAGGPAQQGAELADLLDGLDDHVVYEDRALFPYLRGQLPSLTEALDHAHDEHALVSEQLAALAAALRAGRRYQGPALELARHHFTEEEARILGPALDAGLARTPAGTPGRLMVHAAALGVLAARVGAPPLVTEPAAEVQRPEIQRALDRLEAAFQGSTWLFERNLLGGFRLAAAGQLVRARGLVAHAGVDQHDLAWASAGDVRTLGAILRDSLARTLLEDVDPLERGEVGEEITQKILPLLLALERAAGVSSPRAPRLDAALRPGAGAEALDHPAARALLDDPAEKAGEPTRWGGLRGAELVPAAIREGQRVVTDSGEHGLVTEAHAIVVTAVFGGQRDRDVHHSFTLRLDSGRQALPRGALYEELARPTAVVPDIEVGGRWLAPAEVWSQILGRHREISSYAEKADNARKLEMKRRWQQHSVAARKEFGELYRLLEAWRWAHPDERVEGLDERRWRLFTLEAKERRTEDESWELAWLRRVPPDWSTRFQVGDRVVLHVLGPYGRQPDPGWTLAEIRGHEAVLSRGDVARAEPLWMLKADDSAPLVETFAEPRYLRTLAEEMLVQEGAHKPYPNRGAVARAVKSFLAENGVQVSTRVGQGSMVTGVDLHPPTGAWSADEMARMRALLPGLKVWNAESAALEPWETEGESYDPYGDYRGKSAGLLIPVAHLPRFAAILAGAMKADGQVLNQLGERRLAAGAPARTAVPTGNRGGATAEQRTNAAEGCRELDFELPGYGRIRVVCGQQGRRDQWYNIYWNSDRYGFNGGRWARNQRPPEPVLAAIRERGVSIFDS